MDLKAAATLTETAYAYGTSQGAMAGWDTRGRTGKKITNGLNNGIRVAQRLANSSNKNKAVAAKSVGELQKIRDDAKAKGMYTKQHVEKIGKIADRHTRAGISENPDDEGRRSPHDTVADHLINGLGDAQFGEKMDK